VNLYVSSTYGSAVRRFSTVHMLGPGNHDGASGLLPGVRPLLLSSWDRDTDTFDHRFGRPEIEAHLAAWACCSVEEWRADVGCRKAHLDNMLEQGIRGISATHAALRNLKMG
ncbi:MAG TPA: hypothetical protein VEX13_09130, partial [Chloroflexia bacterium]|nr:hypothetical protein [Chloroflexia bacterium]